MGQCRKYSGTSRNSRCRWSNRCNRRYRRNGCHRRRQHSRRPTRPNRSNGSYRCHRRRQHSRRPTRPNRCNRRYRRNGCHRRRQHSRRPTRPNRCTRGNGSDGEYGCYRTFWRNNINSNKFWLWVICYKWIK